MVRRQLCCPTARACNVFLEASDDVRYSPFSGSNSPPFSMKRLKEEALRLKVPSASATPLLISLNFETSRWVVMVRGERSGWRRRCCWPASACMFRVLMPCADLLVGQNGERVRKKGRS